MKDPQDAPGAYPRLRHDILSLELMPGERLSERALETRLGQSRTPIRAALFRLESEGLVERDVRAWRVTPIDLTEIRALAEYREVLEAAIVRLVIVRARDEDVAALRAVASAPVGADPEESVLQAGTDFHQVLAGLSGNPFLAAAIGDVMTRLTRARYLQVRTPTARTAARHSHSAIVDAIASRDVPLATELVSAHGRDTMTRTIDDLDSERRRLRGRGFAIVES